MPITNEWFIPQRIVLTRLSGDLNISEIMERVPMGTAMIESGDAPVYSLVDVSQVESFPRNLTEYRNAWDFGTSDKLTLLVIYGIKNPLLNLFASVFSQLLRRNFRIVKDLQEAIKVIEEREGAPFIQQALGAATDPDTNAIITSTDSL